MGEEHSAARRAVEALYYVFILSIPLETIFFISRDDGSKGGVTLARIVGVLLFGLALVNRRLCFGRFPAAFWLFAWYLAVFTMSQLWISAKLDEQFHAQQLAMIQLAGLFLISVNLFRNEEFRWRALRLYGWSIGLGAAAMAAGLVGGRLDAGGRDTLFYMNPNAAAAMFGFAALCIGSDPCLREGRWRAPLMLASLPTIALLSAAILRTGSRGGLLSFVAGIAGMVVCGDKTTRLFRVGIAVLSVCVLGLLVSLEFRNGTNTASRFERSLEDGDTAGRMEIYDAAWTMFVEKPLLGWGGANNRFILGTHLNKAGRGERDADRDTHNLFFAVLTEVGLIGGLPFIAALLLALWTAWRSGRSTGDALPFALMCALLVVNCSGTGYRQKVFWIVVAAATSTGLREARRA